MPDQIADDVLRAKGMAVLEEKLGPVEAFRFLALVSRQSFDYQQWRKQHFAGMTVGQIVESAAANRP